MIFKFLSPLIFFVVALQASAQPREVKTDLRADWKVWHEGKYIDCDGQRVNAIHFPLSDKLAGKTLVIISDAEFGLFVNGKILFRKSGELRVSLDSVRSIYKENALLSIYCGNHLKSLQTFLLHQELSPDRNNALRPASYFADFLVIALIILFIFFVVLFRSNTSLTLDYLNITKVFSIQSREDAITTGRIGSSANLLFFVFISLISGLMLMLIDYLGSPVVALPIPFEFPTLGLALLAWLVISLLIFLLLMLKLVLIWIMSSLFAFRDTVRFQYFNFVRSLYVAMVLIGLSGVIYFIGQFHNASFFYFLLWGGCFVMIISTAFLYLKLLSRTGVSLFHLFSYLCGSEIIPLVILIKVLLF